VSIAYFKPDLLSRHLPERIYRNYGNPGRYFSWESKKICYSWKRPTQNYLPVYVFLCYTHTNTHTRTQTRAHARTHTHIQTHARV